jgi:hypothetical protein
VAWGASAVGEPRCAIVSATESFYAWSRGKSVLSSTKPLFSSLTAFDHCLLLNLNFVLWKSQYRSIVTVRDVRANADLNIMAYILEVDFLGTKSLELHIDVRKI